LFADWGVPLSRIRFALQYDLHGVLSWDEAPEILSEYELHRVEDARALRWIVQLAHGVFVVFPCFAPASIFPSGMSQT